jgi:ADP-L-glycero-D-manno-heptose 6-epimerase
MILVTGGAGFIGSNLVARLAERGERVVVADGLGQGDKWRNLARHEIEDIVAPDRLAAYLNDCGDALSAIFHLGAISSTTERNADLLVETNFRLSKSLWTAAAARQLPFIYASSAATYGDGSAGFDDDDQPGSLARLKPLNGYGWSKQLFDRWVVRQRTLEAPAPPFWAGLKFFNVYGPNEYHKGAQASVAWRLFNQIKRGEPARLFKSHHRDYADGGQLRDFLWVGDAVEAMLWLHDQGKVSGIFNLGSGKARSFAELASAVFSALGQDENIEYVPTPEEIRDRYQYYTEAKMDRLRATGFTQSFTPLEEGISCYLSDYLLKDDPYR